MAEGEYESRNMVSEFFCIEFKRLTAMRGARKAGKKN
jgi:hypothetical protein